MSYRSDRWEREQREQRDRELTKLGNQMMTSAEKKASKAHEEAFKARAEAERAQREAEWEAKKLDAIEAALADPYPLIAAAFRKVEAHERANLEKWIEKFRAGPSYELSWAQDWLPQTAIRCELAGNLASRFEEGKDPAPDVLNPAPRMILSEGIRTYIAEEARRLARNLERSTSLTSNWVEDNKRIVYNAWADEKSWDSGALDIDLTDMVRVKMHRFFDAVKLHRDGQHAEAVSKLMKWS